MDFAIAKQWIQIFRGGVQKDSEGRSWNGDELIDKAVSNFDAARHEPPLVVGHPSDNSPAFGWVRGLRKSTGPDGVKILESYSDQVVPEFEAAVKQGLYKKRSASFYPDGRLRHVGFLGGMPPAVKGLKDIGFKADDHAVVFEFGEDSGTDSGQRKPSKREDIMEGLKEFFEGMRSFFSLKKELDAPDPDKKIEGKSFTEAELAETVKTAVAKAVADTTAKFAEDANKAKADARKADLTGRVDALVKSGKVAPAFAETLKVTVLAADSGSEISFGEGKKGTPADMILAGYESGKVLPLFGESATHGTAAAQFAEAKGDWEEGKKIAERVNPPAKK